MTPSRPWLRLAGRLAEDLSFRPETGWETLVVARSQPTGDGTFVVEALDAQGNVLFDTTPAVRFEATAAGAPREAHVVAYVPFLPGTRRLRLRRGAYTIHRRDVAEAPPTLGEVAVELTRARTLHVSWRSEPGPGASPDLVHRVVWVSPGRGVFPLSGDVSGRSFEIPLSRLPGAQDGRVAVLASDGLRSAHALSAPVSVPPRPARVVIHEPRPGPAVPFDQPITLRGAAFDDAGERLDAAGHTWFVDGEIVGSDTRVVTVGPFRPGEHHVVLAWEGASAPAGEARTRFTVAQPPPTDLEPLEPLPTEQVEEGSGPLRIKL